MCRQQMFTTVINKLYFFNENIPAEKDLSLEHDFK